MKDEEICIYNYKHTLRLAFLQRCWSAGWCECFFFDFMCRWRPCGPARTHLITGWGCPGCMCIRLWRGRGMRIRWGVFGWSGFPPPRCVWCACSCTHWTSKGLEPAYLLLEPAYLLLKGRCMCNSQVWSMCKLDSAHTHALDLQYSTLLKTYAYAHKQALTFSF